MKGILTIKLGLAILLLGLFSCESGDSDNAMKLEGLNALNFDPYAAVAKKASELANGECVLLDEYDLRRADGTMVGTAAVCNDGENLNFIFCVNDDYYQSVDGNTKEWRVEFSDLFVGSLEMWPWEEGYVPDLNEIEGAIPPFVKVLHNELSEQCVSRSIPIPEECFIWHAKVRLWNLSDNIQKIIAFTTLQGETDKYPFEPDQEICFDEPGTGTPGYWKNHPEAWPEGGVQICGVDYEYDDAIPFMNSGSNKALDMFTHLICAKLNVDAGNASHCIRETIEDAEDWLCNLGGPGVANVRANSDAWKNGGEDLKDMLDEYNNGLLCAPHRD